ncbi:MAG: pyridoxal phosphate-dependent aminotransferase [Treponema sp.]|jgi:aminotransferase/cystathionine beta-lyase|nr:pyridoxal phosphate-dependent aminotransferase [Treponema sp.]
MYDFTTKIDRSGAGSDKWDGMKKRNPAVDRDIVPFSVADMEFKMAPEITGGLKDYLDNLVLGYTSPTEAYYEAVRFWMKSRHSWDIRDEWLVSSNGVVTALYNCVKSFTDPGGGVIIMPPVYHPFFAAIERNKRRIVANKLLIKNGRYEIDFDDLEAKAADPDNKLLLLSSPHNPVGRVWEKDELRKLGDICLRHGVKIVSDEIHFDLVMPGFRHTVFAALGEEYARNTIVCTAPSKSFNLAGMCSSNIIIPGQELRQKYLEEIGHSMSRPTLNILGYRACEIAYTRCGPWLDELITVIDGNRKIVEEFMAREIPGINVFPLEGTYLQWWDCRGLGMDYRELENFMVHKAQMFLNEGYVFGEEGRGYERINLACPAPVLQAALERLGRALARRAGETQADYRPRAD